MKKFLFLTLVFGAIMSTNTHAQMANTPAGDQAVMLQQIQDKMRPQMVEKTGLTEAQANKVIELNFQLRMSMAQYRDLNEADRSAKLAELRAARDKKYTEIPLTAEQIKAVQAFYESGQKSAPPKQ